MLEQHYDKFNKGVTNIVNDIFSCETKDESGLNDFQKLPTENLIEIPRVGITNYKLPINIQTADGAVRSTDVTAAMYVSLSAQKNGVSMSRLPRILQDEASRGVINAELFNRILTRYGEELRDEGDTLAIKESFLKLKFEYGVKQKSLKSDNWGWQYYPVVIEGKKSVEKGFEYFITIEYFYSSTCPCSLSMAKQYEKDYAAGINTEGQGIGVPHSQRSRLTCKLQMSGDSKLSIEDCITLIRHAIPTETQSLVKRVDEQAFAILNGANPMFVEHASRRLFKVLDHSNEVVDFIASFEHLESLHSHDAVAVIYKNVPGGLRQDNLF